MRRGDGAVHALQEVFPMVLALSLVSLGLAVVGANVAFTDRALTPPRARR